MNDPTHLKVSDGEEHDLGQENKHKKPTKNTQVKQVYRVKTSQPSQSQEESKDTPTPD